MIESLWIGDEFYQVEIRPPLSLEEMRQLEHLGKLLDLELSAFRKVIVCIVRDPLTRDFYDDKLQSREHERNRLERLSGDAPELPF